MVFCLEPFSKILKIHLCGMYSFSAILELVKELKKEAEKASAHFKKASDVQEQQLMPGPSHGSPKPQRGPSSINVEASEEKEEPKKNIKESADEQEATDVAKVIGNYKILRIDYCD